MDKRLPEFAIAKKPFEDMPPDFVTYLKLEAACPQTELQDAVPSLPALIS